MIRRPAALAALALSLAPAAAAADVIALRTRTDAVTVFPSAVSVHRAARLQMRAGEHQLLFGPLPAAMNDESVRIGGFGPGTTVDGVTVRAGRLSEFSAIDLARLNTEIAALESQRADLIRRQAALVRMRDDARQHRSTPDALARAEAAVGEIQQRLQDHARQINERVAEVQRLRTQGDTAVKVAVVDLTNERAGDVALSIEYLVPGAASWRSAYAAHLAPDGAHVGLDVFASVQQATGEDWVNVRMSVSTVMPTTSIALPQLGERSIELEPEPEREAEVEDEIVLRRRMRGAARTMPGAGGRAASAGDMMVPMPRMVAPEPIRQRTASVQTNLLSARLEIPTPVTIRSGAPARRVLAAHADLGATLEHVAAPRESNSVFLAARLRNTQRFPLLGGNVALFVERDYVGSTQLASIPVSEDFLLPFGVDSSVAIDRTLADRRVARAGGRDQTSFRYDYRVTNHRDHAVNVVVYEQVPVSHSHGLIVRTNPGRTFATRRDGDAPGVVRWQLATAAGATERWNLGVTIDAPARREVSGDLE